MLPSVLLLSITNTSTFCPPVDLAISATAFRTEHKHCSRKYFTL
jgi:hypothetical protein